MSAYLTAELPKYIGNHPRRNHAYTYHWIKAKRFLALTIMAFSFQYLCIYHLQSLYPIYPLYPAIGITFTVIFILGENAILGLLLGGMCAYYLRGNTVSFIALYSMADMGCACLGVYLCRNVFVSDIPRYATLGVWARFTLINVLVTSLSAFLRITAIVMGEAKLPELSTLLYVYMDLWLADLNAIILFYAFLSTWLSIYMSREKVSLRKITLYHIMTFIVFIVVSLWMMKKIAFVYFLLAGMGMIVYFSYLHGIVIATLLMYAISMLYLAYFTMHQVYYLKWLGIGLYTIVPGFLLVFIMSMIVASKVKLLGPCYNNSHRISS